MSSSVHYGVGVGVVLSPDQQEQLAQKYADLFRNAPENDPLLDAVFYETDPAQIYLPDVLEELHKTTLEVVTVENQDRELYVILYAKSTYQGEYGGGFLITGPVFPTPTVVEKEMLNQLSEMVNTPVGIISFSSQF